jgi:hypothetical protein
MKEARGCLLEYLIYIVETFFLVFFWLIANLYWIILAILIGGVFSLIINIIWS